MSLTRLSLRVDENVSFGLMFSKKQFLPKMITWIKNT